MSVPRKPSAVSQDRASTTLASGRLSKRDVSPRVGSMAARQALQQTLSLPFIPPSIPPKNPSSISPSGSAPQQPSQDAPSSKAVAPVAYMPRPHLWLCIYLPALSLEALFRRDEKAPCAIYEEQKGIRRIVQASSAARSAGVSRGMSMNAALSLLPDLNLAERSTAQEQQLLKRLAEWSGRFTSFVTATPPNLLLLEVAGSARLFDGVEAIRNRVAHGLDSQGITAVLAIAPTPLASIWLARAGREQCIDDVSRLTGALNSLPLGCLEWPLSVIEKLHGVGARTIGDCLRLPRPGFSRRFGAALLMELDQATGKLSDPREKVRSTERFCAEREFDEEQDDQSLLLAACHTLLLELADFLRTRQQQIQCVQFQFFHLQADATSLVLGRVRAGQSAEHWLELLRIRLERMALRAPVIAVRLRGGSAQEAALKTRGLLEHTAVGQRDTTITELVERLGARIGDASVYGVDTVDEHRPQHAWRAANLLQEVPRCATVGHIANPKQVPQLLHALQRDSSVLLRRPLWLLDEPERLVLHKGRPLYQGALMLLDGPERLESGWWDEEGIARDYFIASTHSGLRLWIYRDRKKHQAPTSRAVWYLHGLFG